MANQHFFKVDLMMNKNTNDTKQAKMNKKIQHKIVNIFLPIIFSICFGCSKEPSH